MDDGAVDTLSQCFWENSQNLCSQRHFCDTRTAPEGARVCSAGGSAYKHPFGHRQHHNLYDFGVCGGGNGGPGGRRSSQRPQTGWPHHHATCETTTGHDVGLSGIRVSSSAADRTAVERDPSFELGRGRPPHLSPGFGRRLGSYTITVPPTK